MGRAANFSTMLSREAACQQDPAEGYRQVREAPFRVVREADFTVVREAHFRVVLAGAFRLGQPVN